MTEGRGILGIRANTFPCTKWLRYCKSMETCNLEEFWGFVARETVVMRCFLCFLIGRGRGHLSVVGGIERQVCGNEPWSVICIAVTDWALLRPVLPGERKHGPLLAFYGSLLLRRYRFRGCGGCEGEEPTLKPFVVDSDGNFMALPGVQSPNNYAVLAVSFFLTSVSQFTVAPGIVKNPKCQVMGKFFAKISVRSSLPNIHQTPHEKVVVL